jgi:hypothetical protein
MRIALDDAHHDHTSTLGAISLLKYKKPLPDRLVHSVILLAAF